MRRSMTVMAAAAAAIAVLALGAAGALAETVVKKKQFDTTVTAAFTQTTPPGGEYTNPSGNFSGKVSSPKNKCVKSRGVTVKPPTGPNTGQATTNNSGDWTIPGNNLTPGNYTVSVAKNKIIKEKDKPNGTHVKKKIVCNPVTATVAVP